MCDENRFWKAVERAVANAVSITWDGCHKIYIHMDEKQHGIAIGYGYDPIRIEDTAEAVKLLRGWYGKSCELRFITAVSSVDGDPNKGYHSLIPQFAEEAD
ncbi:MAG: hypothetical protein ACYSWU_22235 [Planctomycetota bacterium]|jgi:hypothetical protein